MAKSIYLIILNTLNEKQVLERNGNLTLFLANLLGLPSSTLSKRWREASGKKQWPYRDSNQALFLTITLKVKKIERQLKTLLTNSETMKSNKGELAWSGMDIFM